MPTTISLYAEKAYGQTGNYVARLTGRNSQFTFEREFLGASVLVDTPGIYEVRDVDRKGRKTDSYTLVLSVDIDNVEDFRAEKEDAMKICKLLDAGERLEDIVHSFEEDGNLVWGFRDKKAEAEKAKSSVLEQCYELLKTLSEADAKKIIKELKDRISPPKAKSSTPSEPMLELATEPNVL